MNIYQQLTAPIFRNVCPVTHIPEDGGSKLLGRYEILEERNMRIVRCFRGTSVFIYSTASQKNHAT